MPLFARHTDLGGVTAETPEEDAKGANAGQSPARTAWLADRHPIGLQHDQQLDEPSRASLLGCVAGFAGRFSLL